MATNSTTFDSVDTFVCVNPIEHFGVCPVCVKEYEDPVWLKCCHTICRGCLKGRDGQPVMAFENIICPVCEAATMTNGNGLDGLMSDTFAKKVAELSKLKKSKQNINKVRCSGECMQVCVQFLHFPESSYGEQILNILNWHKTHNSH